MKKIAMFVGALAMAAGLSAHSHEAKEVEAAAAKAQAAVAGAAKQAAGAVQDARELAAAAKGAVVVQMEPLQALRENAPRHLHNKIVHFPIALGAFGVLFFLLSLKWAQYLWPSRLLLGAGLLGALASLPTGEAMEEAVEGTSLVNVLGAHERAGQTAAALLAVTLVLTFFPSARKWSWLVAVAAVGFLFLAGGLGGVLAHS